MKSHTILHASISPMRVALKNLIMANTKSLHFSLTPPHHGPSKKSEAKLFPRSGKECLSVVVTAKESFQGRVTMEELDMG